jgi:hypothetical protein
MRNTADTTERYPPRLFGMTMKIKMHVTNASLKDAGYSIEQEAQIYDDQLQEIFDSPRTYLDNLASMVSYKVRWKNYKNTRPVVPYKYVKQKTL